MTSSTVECTHCIQISNSYNDFDINTNDLNLENDVWYIETSINFASNFSRKMIQRSY